MLKPTKTIFLETVSKVTENKWINLYECNLVIWNYPANVTICVLSSLDEWLWITLLPEGISTDFPCWWNYVNTNSNCTVFVFRTICFLFEDIGRKIAALIIKKSIITLRTWNYCLLIKQAFCLIIKIEFPKKTMRNFLFNHFSTIKNGINSKSSLFKETFRSG
jgi:hypothetical protein